MTDPDSRCSSSSSCVVLVQSRQALEFGDQRVGFLRPPAHALECRARCLEQVPLGVRRRQLRDGPVVPVAPCQRLELCQRDTQVRQRELRLRAAVRLQLDRAGRRQAVQRCAEFLARRQQLEPARRGRPQHHGAAVASWRARVASAPRSLRRSSASRPRYATAAAGESGCRRKPSWKRRSSARSASVERTLSGNWREQAALVARDADQCLDRLAAGVARRPELPPVPRPCGGHLVRRLESAGQRCERRAAQRRRPLTRFAGHDRPEQRVVAHPGPCAAAAREFLQRREVGDPAQPGNAIAPCFRLPLRDLVHAAQPLVARVPFDVVNAGARAEARGPACERRRAQHLQHRAEVGRCRDVTPVRGARTRAVARLEARLRVRERGVNAAHDRPT